MTSRSRRLARPSRWATALRVSVSHTRRFVVGLTACFLLIQFGVHEAAEAQAPGANAPTPNPFDIKIAKVITAEPGVESRVVVQIGLTGPAAEETALLFRGLPRDARLTQGLTDGAGTWAVPVTRLQQLAIVVPTGSAGQSTITLELVGSTGTRLSHATTALVIAPPAFVKPEQEPLSITVQGSAGDQQGAALATAAIGAVKGYTATLPPAAQAQPAAAPPEPTAGALGLSGAGRDQALKHMARGDALLKDGNVSAARLFYERAAAQGWGPAALALGATYDAIELSRMGAFGVAADPAKARAWYEKARDLGAPEALARLGRSR